MISQYFFIFDALFQLNVYESFGIGSNYEVQPQKQNIQMVILRVSLK